MGDYVDAFKQGLAAAETAERARREIAQVFVELDQEVGKGSGGKISINRREYEVRQQFWDISFPPKPKQTYWAIVACNPTVDEGPVKELARWSQDRAGYPCKIVWGNEEHTCEDREALENSLAEVLRDPIVGERLYALMRLESSPPKEDLEQQEDPVDKE